MASKSVQYYSEGQKTQESQSLLPSSAQLLPGETARKLQVNILGQPEYEMKLQLETEVKAVKSDDIYLWNGTGKDASLSKSIQQVKNTKHTKIYHKLNAWVESKQMTCTKRPKPTTSVSRQSPHGIGNHAESQAGEFP